MSRTIQLATGVVATFAISCGAWAQPAPAADFSKLRAAAERGDRDAELHLAEQYEADGPRVDHKLAFYWTRRAAEHGQVNAWLPLGMHYGSGDGVELDRVEAYKWFDLFDRFAPKTGKGTAEMRGFAVEDRAAMARRLTPAQVAEAKAREEAWLREWNRKAAAAPRGGEGPNPRP